ncbi:zinc finger and BTB domain-containing protein 21 [Erpetoichthys calabaricus]|uniref:zinc finger and BTB domain-containing protein 21 n=1 Tax=Erpetoichthys calabaricus TaxID=27687 RepID=UPI002234AD08|nr:zinc finger and BTB domain-containing protein 21 [Erpetoichthys calabaricus]
MEDLLHYVNPAHGISLLSSLNEQRLKGQLCDVVLIVGDHKFRAHRNVLAGSSEYFHTLFSSKDREAHTIVQLDFCEPDAFENVLNYLYSSSLVVEKDNLAAVQELGYSLGISYLTNILSKKPRLPYLSSGKKTAFSHNEGGPQQRSVIVCQNRNSKPSTSCQNEVPAQKMSGTLQASTKPLIDRNCRDLPYVPLNEPRHFCEKNGNLPPSTVQVPDTLRNSKNSTQSPLSNVSQKTQQTSMSSNRPQLTSSLSFNESYLMQDVQPNCSRKNDGLSSLLQTKASPGAIASKLDSENKSIDRSGPLVKSLLRRSLSMDSPVPVCSLALDLKSSHVPKEPVFSTGSEKLLCRTSPDCEYVQTKSNIIQTLQLRPGIFIKSESASNKTLKAEPSSPLADPSDIIRITVGESLPVNFRDLQGSAEEGPRTLYKHNLKRKCRLDNKRSQQRKKKGSNNDFNIEEYKHNVDDNDSDTDEDLQVVESRQSRMFKCWSCIKVFRSNTGLYRHVNMYHNPEKPYSCDICHKRFHTNFKVWTHCQTQHGIVKNPAPVSSSYSVLDDKFQRKLIDIVREREVKKALMVKLRRSKQSCQAQQFGRWNLRTRSKTYFCNYCGKVFRFHSQFKQHLKMHPGEKTLSDEDYIPKEKEQATSPIDSKKQEFYPCRLCNAKLTSVLEQGDHERMCRNATVCPYCNLRFTTPELKMEHESHCDYKKLTCLECMRTFKSSFSIWRHQVEVHNQNTMTSKENQSHSLSSHNGEVPGKLKAQPSTVETKSGSSSGASKDEMTFSSSSEQMHFDSEDSSYLPEDLTVSHKLALKIKEEPMEDAVEDELPESGAEPISSMGDDEKNVWPCEKCGKLFTVRKQLERHQELLCHIKPFICHVCSKAFRTNFRLWSHFQSHMAGTEEIGVKDSPPPSSPSPPSFTSAIPSLPPPRESPKQFPTLAKAKVVEPEKTASSTTTSSMKKNSPVASSQESDSLFYHAHPLSAITFKRQYMCKLCHRTFKTAFSLWSHEQSHTNM